VTFDAGGSSDPDPGDVLTYSWDLNGDGVYGDATGVSAATTFTAPGNHIVAVKVTDDKGASSTARTSIAVGPALPPSPSTCRSPRPAGRPATRSTSRALRSTPPTACCPRQR